MRFIVFFERKVIEYFGLTIGIYRMLIKEEEGQKRRIASKENKKRTNRKFYFSIGLLFFTILRISLFIFPLGKYYRTFQENSFPYHSNRL